MINIFNHPDIKKHINTDKYNTFLSLNKSTHQFNIFCSRCYKLSGNIINYDSKDCMSYEDQVIHMLIFKYFFEGTKI